MQKILLVDDDINILQGYKRHLHKIFEVETALDGKSALEVLKNKGPFAVITSDLKMPGMNGIEFLGEARKRAPNTVRILLTGEAGFDNAINAVNEGNIFRFLTKPCPPASLRQTLEAGVAQYKLVVAERELLGKTLNGVIKLLTDILAMVSPLAFSRTNRIRKLTHNIATRLNAKNIWGIDLAASLSQIGCVTLSTKILEKKEKGIEMTKDEKAIFLDHPKIGMNLLINIPRFQQIAEAIGSQENHFEDTGQATQKLKYGKAIPLAARILKAVNDYDGFVATGLPPQEAVYEMQNNQEISSRYDPDVLAALKAEMLKAEEGFVVQEISVNEIKTGMVLAAEIKTKSNQLLVPNHYEISESVRIRIVNFAEKDDVVEPIRVLGLG